MICGDVIYCLWTPRFARSLGFCGNDWEFMINWPTLMSLWQAKLVISTSTDVCEHCFLKHNWFKSERRTRLNLDTLDALMRVSLNGFGVEFMDWNGIFESWKTTTRTNKQRAFSLQEVELDGWFLILHMYWKHVPYNSCTSLICIMFIISIFLDWRLGFEPTF